MPYDKLIQRGDVAAFTSDTSKRGKTPATRNRVIQSAKASKMAVEARLNANAGKVPKK